MKSKVLILLISFLLGGISLGAAGWLDRQAEIMEERQALLERKAQLTEELEAAADTLSETEEKLTAVQREFAVYQEELSGIREKTVELQENCREDLSLYEAQTGGLPVNYDVENFRVKQRDSEQMGQMGNLFGSLFGNITQSSQQEYSARGQENRFDFYGKLTNFLGESYWESAVAESAFEGAYLSCQKLGELESDVDILANRALLEKADDNLYEERREEFLDALAKYLFDLNCVYLIYDNTLTENEKAFLSEMRQQIDSLKAVLASYDSDGNYTGAGESLYGYSPEEKADRGLYVFGLYAEAAKMLINYLYVDGAMKLDSDLTAYHVGTIHGYSSRGDIVMLWEEDNPFDTDTWEYRFYDHEGNPLYLEEHQGQVLFLDGEAAAFRAVTEVLQTQAVYDQLVSNAERMFTDYANGVLGDTYQNYAY